jgi:hypothetical protein
MRRSNPALPNGEQAKKLSNQHTTARYHESEAIMEVRFFLTGEDLWNFTKYSLLRTRVLLRFILILVILLALIFFTTALSPTSNTLVNILPLILLFFVLLLLPLVLRWGTRATMGHNTALQGEHSIIISPEGFRHQSSLSDAMISWHAVKTIAADKYNLYFLIQTNRLVGHIVPRRAFATPQHAETFLAWAQTYWANAQAAPPAGPAGTGAAYEHWN